MKNKNNIIIARTFQTLCLIILFLSNLKAQQKDTSLFQLNEITILEKKQSHFEPSKKRNDVDSTIIHKYNTSSISELLANQSTIHIKSYGNGNIATTSMRGGSSNHTALLWNGLNIQNAKLGQTDLSILPTTMFNSVSIEYGGGSALWGSGAIGGSILLNNKLNFNKGLQTNLQLSLGSFETKKINSSILLSYKKIASNTTLYFSSSENNYNYLDTTDKINSKKNAKHANFNTIGLLQELAFKINTFQQINARIWYNNTDRNIPNFNGIQSKKNQLDKNLKFNADWSLNKNKLQSIIRLGILNDKLNYNDSLSNLISSKSTIQTFIIESDNVYTHNNHRFNLGVNYTSYQTNLNYSDVDTNYINSHSLLKGAVFAAYNVELLKSKLNYNLSVRKEFSNLFNVPLTGNTGLKYLVLKFLAIKVNANKSFRQPTLNDLYWKPGGNPNLKPEESYEYEGGIEINHLYKKIKINFEGTYFNRHTYNWITWLPIAGYYWTPRNIAEVYSRGTETQLNFTYSQKEMLIKLFLKTSYVISTNQKAINENDNSVGKQLIYTPRYNGIGGIIAQYKNISLLFNNSYTGYRFTSTDNSSWLTPYLISNLKLSYTYTHNEIDIEFFGSVNNLFNKNYMVINMNPMPLRNYEVGIRLHYNQQKKNKEKTPSITEIIKSKN